MEVSKRPERPKRMAALRSQQITRNKLNTAQLETSTDTDGSSVRIVKVVASVKGHRSTSHKSHNNKKNHNNNDEVVDAEQRPESPQMYGPTQNNTEPETFLTDARRKSPPKRQRLHHQDTTSSKQRNLSGTEKESAPKAHTSGTALRRTRSCKETESSLAQHNRRPTKVLVITSSEDEEEEDDLFIMQEKVYNVRETRSKSKSKSNNKVGQHSKSASIQQPEKKSSKSAPAPASKKKTDYVLVPPKEAPPTVVLTEEEEESDTETQLPVAEGQGQEQVSTAVGVAGIVTAAKEYEDEIGMDNIVQSILESSAQLLQKQLDTTSITEIITQDTPPASSASSPSRQSSKRVQEYPGFVTLSANHEKELSEIPNTPTDANDDTHHEEEDEECDANDDDNQDVDESNKRTSHSNLNALTHTEDGFSLSQDLFTSTQFDEEHNENLVLNSAIEDSEDVDTSRSSPIPETPVPSSVASRNNIMRQQPALLRTETISLDPFMEQNSNSNSRDSISSVVTVIKNTKKRHAECEPLDEDESHPITFSNSLASTPKGNSRKTVQMEETSFIEQASKFQKQLRKKTSYTPRLRLTSTKRSTNAAKIGQLKMNSPYNESISLSGISHAKPMPFSKALKNASMRDSGDYYIASASEPLNDVEDNDETVLEDSSEINLSNVVDKAGAFQNSITYEDPSILTTLAYDPLRKCRDLITQQLLLKLSTNASVGLLENAIRDKGLNTVGDLCSLHILNIQKLPIAPSPKLEAFRSVMRAYAQEHYPNVLSQIQQESSEDHNAEDVHYDTEDLPLGQANNRNETNSDHDGGSADTEREDVNPADNEHSQENGGSEHEEVEAPGLNKRDHEKPLLEQIVGGDWVGFLSRIFKENLTSEEKKEFLKQVIGEIIDSK